MKKIVNTENETAELAKQFSKSMQLPLIVGFFAAFISGLLACKWMIALVKRSKLTSFAIYCASIGLIAVIYALTV